MNAGVLRRLDSALTGSSGPVITGVLVGVCAPLLVVAGNPLNAGLSVSCFLRDIAGALGLHGSEHAQYLRPEIPGLTLGALAAALASGEFRPRQGSSPLIRFLLGFLAMTGAAVFLGCPWRAVLRLGAGDLNALWGILGLALGVQLGIQFLRGGFDLGRQTRSPPAVGWVAPTAAVALLALLMVSLAFAGRARGGTQGPPYFSQFGCGALRAPIWLSLALAIAIGIVAQRSRFCVVAALRNVILMRHYALARGLGAMLVSTAITNVLLGLFVLGFEGQPIAHTSAVWNLGGMLLTGVAITLAGGCPSRQLVLAGEGDADAGAFVLGMLFGAALTQSFRVASSSGAVGRYGPHGVITALILCICIGLAMRQPVPE